MKKILAGADGYVASWVRERTHIQGAPSPCSAIGLAENGELIAGVLYDMFTGENINMHVAAVGKHWLNRTFLRECFRYPFQQLRVRRVTGLVPASNTAARRFDEHLGFKLEGIMREAGSDAEDIIVYGMLKNECRWLNG